MQGVSSDLTGNIWEINDRNRTGHPPDNWGLNNAFLNIHELQKSLKKNRWHENKTLKHVKYS